MKYFLRLTTLIATLFTFHISLPSNASEINKIIDDFTNSPERRWQFYTDQVMGGVSEGGASVRLDSEGPYVRLEGLVSTANNGGFIQIRRNLKNFNLNNAKNIKIVAKGNNDEYFIHLRTSNTILPWQYYQSSFIVTNNFKKFIFPIDEFQKSGFFLPTKINSKTIKSIGIVAFGKDYDAELIVQQISFTN